MRANPMADSQNNLSAAAARLPVEKLAYQNRERIPERQRITRNWAFGIFTVNQDVAQYGKARISAGIGNKAVLIARFSNDS